MNSYKLPHLRFPETENKLYRLRSKALCNIETPPLGMAVPLDGSLPGLLLCSWNPHMPDVQAVRVGAAQEGCPGMPALWMEFCSAQTAEGRLCLGPELYVGEQLPWGHQGEWEGVVICMGGQLPS